MKLKFGNATDRYWYNKNTYVSYTVTYIYIHIYVYNLYKYVEALACI